MASDRYVISAFYKFVAVDDVDGLRDELDALARECGLIGTVLVASEGINGTVSAHREGHDRFFAAVRADERFADLETKESFSDGEPFKRLKVRRKTEIVSLRRPVDPTERVGTYVEPEDWNHVLHDPDVLIVDTRNREEIELGTFENAVDPGTDRFSQFPDWVAGIDPAEHPRIAMFCTGGIRCEKASAYMLDQGFEEVLHLRGGILNYFERVDAADSLWDGECFVFDERVSVGHDLTPGRFELCRGCRRPLDDAARSAQGFEDGVSCPSCVDELDDESRRRRRERHRQELLARQRGERHIGRKA